MKHLSIVIKVVSAVFQAPSCGLGMTMPIALCLCCSIFLCVGVVPKEVLGMPKQGGYRQLCAHRLSIPFGEMPLSSPGLAAQTPGEVSA